MLVKELLSPEYINLISLALPIVLLSKTQARQILNRDHNQCQFPFDHECGRKLTVHHIVGKKDEPENLVCVCGNANWKHLHNGQGPDSEAQFASSLAIIAIHNTHDARENRNWTFDE